MPTEKAFNRAVAVESAVLTSIVVRHRACCLARPTLFRSSSDRTFRRKLLLEVEMIAESRTGKCVLVGLIAGSSRFGYIPESFWRLSKRVQSEFGPVASIKSGPLLHHQIIAVRSNPVTGLSEGWGFTVITLGSCLWDGSGSHGLQKHATFWPTLGIRCNC